MEPAIMKLRELSARIFGHVWNPTCVRTGHKYLRKALKGPQIASYYPPSLNELHSKLYRDPIEASRQAKAQLMRKLGKGPPKTGAYNLKMS